ncbi:MAG: DinB family protein [Cyclobacteriaceae bacterium]|nr:DinB family protein [Cyclobacteriaceae bacterium]
MDELKQTIAGHESLIEEMANLFRKFSKEETDAKPAPGKWSKKEILGHLCDSAFNNMQRLVRVQYEASPAIVYDQDQWVKCNNYQVRSADEVLELWIILHRQFIHTLKSFPENLLDSTIMAGEVVTARFVIIDYLRHQRHHLEQIKA